MWILISVMICVFIQTVSGQGVCRCREKTGCPDNCNSVCESGYSGPSCHSANIAVGRTAAFSGRTEVTSGTAALTVDGNTTDSNCVSVRGSNHQLQIRFSEIRTVTELRIFWSIIDVPTGRIAAVIGNRTCDLRSTSSDGREVTYTCFSLQADRVRIFNQVESGTMTVCEVEIYECVDGFYGTYCTSRCNCNGITKCDKVNGRCPPSALTTTTATTTLTTTPTTTSTTPSTTSITTTRTTPSTTPITTSTTSTRTTTATLSTSSATTTTTTSLSSAQTISTTATTETTATTTSDLSSTTKLPDTTTVTVNSTLKAPDFENVYSGPGTTIIIAAVIVAVIALVLIVVIVAVGCRINRSRDEEGMMDPSTTEK